MMQTSMKIRGEDVPVINNAAFLIEFGPTSPEAQMTWFGGWRLLLAQASPVPGLPIPVDVLADSPDNGRMVVRVWAPDPQAVVDKARELADGEGPRVQPF